jgi:hypothetical protein
MFISPRSFLIVVLLASSGATAQARGRALSIGQLNPGAIDINRKIDPQALVTQVGVTPTGVSSPGSAPAVVLQPNADAHGLPLTATSSGAIAATTSGAIPTSIGGTAVLGATGRDMAECMAAWDRKTHITKLRWREICESTLGSGV